MSFLNDKNIAVFNGNNFRLNAYDTAYTADLEKDSSKKRLEDIKEELSEWQNMLYAQDKYSILLVFQAMDAAGKDGTIKSVMTGVNPQGCQVVSFKAPSYNELDHDYLWRCYKELPQRGRIGIFNRSYYEEVLVTRVHPEYILNQRLPNLRNLEDINDEFWSERFQSIRQFEKHLTENGTIILKFFLNVSKEEQRQRFLERIDQPDKNWKFSYRDIEERKHWDAYQHAYEQAIMHTATSHAPWFVIPSDKNWARNLMVCEVILETLKKLNLHYPVLSDKDRELLGQAKDSLNTES